MRKIIVCQFIEKLFSSLDKIPRFNKTVESILTVEKLLL